MLENLVEGMKNFGIMAAPFIIGCPIVLAIENHKAHKEMKARHKKRFEEIKRNNRQRKLNNL